jgi:hemerythrin
LSFVNWREEFNIGHKLIDGHHKKLVGILNSLHNFICEDKGQEAIASTLVELHNYTRFHFEEEEKLMKEINFSRLEEHTLEHEKLLEVLNLVLISLKEGKEFKSQRLLEFVRNWVLDHIIEEDRKVGQAYLAYKSKNEAVELFAKL